MPPFKPISRDNLIRALRKAGFDGPYSGGRHQFMFLGDLTLTLPNPHRGDIGKDLLLRILKQADITREKFEAL